MIAPARARTRTHTHTHKRGHTHDHFGGRKGGVSSVQSGCMLNKTRKLWKQLQTLPSGGISARGPPSGSGRKWNTFEGVPGPHCRNYNQCHIEDWTQKHRKGLEGSQTGTAPLTEEEIETSLTCPRSQASWCRALCFPFALWRLTCELRHT